MRGNSQLVSLKTIVLVSDCRHQLYTDGMDWLGTAEMYFSCEPVRVLIRCHDAFYKFSMKNIDNRVKIKNGYANQSYLFTVVLK